MIDQLQWFAIKARNVFEAERCLEPLCDAVYLPKEEVKVEGSSRRRLHAIIPKLMFIKTGAAMAEELECKSRDSINRMEPFRIYRNIAGTRLQPISDREMQLVILLTSQDDTRCEVYRKDLIKAGDMVRVTAGPFEGYQGYARRIRNNKHVVVEIEGVCAIALPFIHTDLLEKIVI